MMITHEDLRFGHGDGPFCEPSNGEWELHGGKKDGKERVKRASRIGQVYV